MIYRGAEEYSALDADAVIVLGAGVNGENPSLVLQTRIRAARDYIAGHPDIPVVLSGGQGPGEDITEAEAMRRALEETGAELLLEERSTSTEENLAFSKEVLTEYGIDAESARIAIVTNGFHVTRACMLASEQGYETVFGVGAPIPWWWLPVNYYLREAFALIKDLIF
ncbi:MAG: YdcF family protein [Oscillospiraceae bacterium]|nr:YdcF family protein [Oscillospiraceae bacterium]